MKVLLTNDDGIDAKGLRALAEALPRDVEPVLVAPANQKSASSHSITLGAKLRVIQRKGTAFPEYEVHGTPADCVKIAISEIKGFYPDLIVSGVNHGANTGVSVYYSGTISAAREGLINRIPSVALSLCSRTYENFEASQNFAKRVIQGYVDGAFPKNIMLNVNIPPLAESDIKGAKITKQAESHFIEEFIEEKAHDGVRVFSLAGEIEIFDADGTSDEEAISEGFISVTPLKLDLTDYTAISVLKKWVHHNSVID